MTFRHVFHVCRFALATGLCMVVCAATLDCARGQAMYSNTGAASSGPYASLPSSNGQPYQATSSPYPTTNAVPVATSRPTQPAQQMSAPTQQMSGIVPVDPGAYPTSASWIVPGDGYQNQSFVDADAYCDCPPYPTTQEGSLFTPPGSEAWGWQVLPEGLIYRSYWAGIHEPRLGVQMIRDTDNGDSFWDPTLGARVGILRFGNGDPFHPQGWEWDAEAAALARLTLDDIRDLETVDFRGGTFLSYGAGLWQFKIGYDHLSSHLGDEFAIAHPGSLANRINYVRDSIVAGASYYPIPELRLYSEAGYAINADGGAEPWEFQFGTELAKAGPTGPAGSPFLAMNVHLREEVDFGGDFTAQTGWMWRGMSGQTMRIGAHYFNGKSSQYQTFNMFEQQVGLGVWYDF